MDTTTADFASLSLPAAADVGTLGIFHLKRYWARVMLARQGHPVRVSQQERHRDHLVIHATGLGIEQTARYLESHAPAFEDFERWIVATTGGVAPQRVARINAALAGSAYPDDIKRWLGTIDAAEPVLSEDDLAFWEEHGYVVLHDAVPAESLEGATQALWDHLGASPEEPDTWYRRSDHGIMVQYFQHPAFEANRRSARIHKAFAQLWGTADLRVTTDRVGFNVPERQGWRFPGPDLHWDVSLKTPIPLGIQGILYLTDTPPQQGAFTLVPGFHRGAEAWLKNLPAGADPRRQDLHALGSKPIGGRAGDLVMWHHALPHGSRPNHRTRPRMAQYIAMFPTVLDEQDEWI